MNYKLKYDSETGMFSVLEWGNFPPMWLAHHTAGKLMAYSNSEVAYKYLKFLYRQQAVENGKKLWQALSKQAQSDILVFLAD